MPRKVIGKCAGAKGIGSFDVAGMLIIRERRKRKIIFLEWCVISWTHVSWMTGHKIREKRLVTCWKFHLNYSWLLQVSPWNLRNVQKNLENKVGWHLSQMYDNPYKKTHINCKNTFAIIVTSCSTPLRDQTRRALENDYTKCRRKVLVRIKLRLTIWSALHCAQPQFSSG